MHMASLAHEPSAAVAPGPRILLVEDDREIGDLVEEYLTESLGMRVVRAYDAAEALYLIDLDAFDLVFTDVMMPGELNGVQMARIMRSNYPELPIVIATGNAPKECLKDSEDFPLLQKPYRLSQVRQKISMAGIPT